MRRARPGRRFPPPNPGEVLAEDFLRPLGLSHIALARAIGVPQIRVRSIVRGKRAITPDTALRLARVFGTSAEFWLAMQTAHDLMVAREAVGAAINGRHRLRAA